MKIPVKEFPLFLFNNNIVDLGWFEREAQTTSTTKWDRVAFAVKDKRITPVLVEFSGGIKFNTTDKKENDDETKMVEKILNILKYMEALKMVDYPIPQHYIRFFGGKIIFECIYLMKNGEYIKRKYFTITCPTTCEELILLVKKIPRLLDWKQTIIMQTKQTLAYDE